jgi:hypothetical protein
MYSRLVERQNRGHLELPATDWAGDDSPAQVPVIRDLSGTERALNDLHCSLKMVSPIQSLVIPDQNINGKD